eukprot:1012461-Heterocapsa_arctica.AAC.1
MGVLRLVRVVRDVGGRDSAARAAARHRGSVGRFAIPPQVFVAPANHLQELRQLGFRARQHALE